MSDQSVLMYGERGQFTTSQSTISLADRSTARMSEAALVGGLRYARAEPHPKLRRAIEKLRKHGMLEQRPHVSLVRDHDKQ
jgi:hypothetical protein